MKALYDEIKQLAKTRKAVDLLTRPKGPVYVKGLPSCLLWLIPADTHLREDDPLKVDQCGHTGEYLHLRKKATTEVYLIQGLHLEYKCRFSFGSQKYYIGSLAITIFPIFMRTMTL